jgi:hypothetical protein
VLSVSEHLPVDLDLPVVADRDQDGWPSGHISLLAGIVRSTVTGADHRGQQCGGCKHDCRVSQDILTHQKPPG